MTRNLVRTIRLFVAPAFLWLASLTPIQAQEIFNGWGGFGFGGGTSCGSCGTCEKGCQSHHCPPSLMHCEERPPCIRVKCGCPKPICNPCNQPGWGYYETCWSPWPWPPNYNHCQTLPPAATIALSGPNNPQTPFYGPGRDGRELPPQSPPQGGPQVPPRSAPPMAPTYPPANAPNVPTTPGMPRMQLPMQPVPQPVPQPMPPQTQPMPIPGGGIDSLPVPRPETPPRPLPGPGNY